MGETLKSGREADQNLPEREPLPKYPVLVLGAGQGTGAEMALYLGRQGYPVIAGTRSREKFDKLNYAIHEAGGLEAVHFSAELTDEEAVKAAYKGLHLEPGTPVHFLNFAAGGFQTMKRAVMRPLIPISRVEKEGGTITLEMLREATDKIRQNVLTDNRALRQAMDVNYFGARRVGELLYKNRHLTPKSKILYPSSNISDMTDPNNPEDFIGPWFYWLIGCTKQFAVGYHKGLALATGATFINLVAPEIEGTEVGNMVDNEFVPLFKRVGIDLVVPKVTMHQVADAGYRELTRNTPNKNRTIYVTDKGVLYTRPKEFAKPLVPYF